MDKRNHKERYDDGLKTRSEVLGKAYVEKSMAGVDIAHEDRAVQLLEEMARRKVMVEIALMPSYVLISRTGTARVVVRPNPVGTVATIDVTLAASRGFFRWRVLRLILRSRRSTRD